MEGGKGHVASDPVAVDTGQSGLYLLTQLIDQFVEGETAAAAPAAPGDAASGRLHEESGSAFRTKQGWRGRDHGNLGSFLLASFYSKATILAIKIVI
jgi:hypothetical protein